MLKPLLLACMIGSIPAVASAACPAAVPGNTPEAISANGARLVCLQNELAAATRHRQFELELNELERLQQDMLIRQRIDALPKVPVYVPVPMDR
jgi:hypothetical protein